MLVLRSLLLCHPAWKMQVPRAGSPCPPHLLSWLHSSGKAFPPGLVSSDPGAGPPCASSPPTASGLYIQSSEALHVVTNVIHANRVRGITVAQSSQLTRVANNSISCNRQSGVKIEAQCKVELRGNGIYDNRGHGIITKGDSTVMENDIIGNRGSGLQLLPTSDTKVCVSLCVTCMPTPVLGEVVCVCVCVCV